MATVPRRDSDASKGAIDLYANLAAQLPHRDAGRPDRDYIDGEDTDFPEPGSNAEHSGEKYTAE
jgi:hypothetical protein